MSEFVRMLNNCLEIFNSCKPKDSTNNNSTKNPESEKILEMSEQFTLHLPKRPKFGDEIRIKAKLKQQPKE